VQLAAALGQKPGGHAIAGQRSIHKHDAPVQPADPSAVMGQVLDLQFDLGRSGIQFVHVVIHMA
jgi:hypothetical protein